MANTYNLISTYTVPAGGISVVSFSGISNIYKDLLVISLRGSASSSSNSAVTINNQNNTSNYNRAYGYTVNQTATYGGIVATGQANWIDVTNTNAMGNYMQSSRHYFPNANGSNGKTMIAETIQEYNSNNSYCYLFNGFNTGITSAISSIEFRNDGSTWTQDSVFSLYGIKNS